MGMGGWFRLEQTEGMFFWFCCCLIINFFGFFFFSLLTSLRVSLPKAALVAAQPSTAFCRGPISLAVKAWRDEAALCRQGRIHAVGPGSGLGSNWSSSSCLCHQHGPPLGKCFN